MTVIDATAPPTTVADLRDRVDGTVLVPEDPGYDDSRSAFNLTVDQRPALIVRPVSAGDVAESIRYARATGMDVAIQATGHGLARPADGAVLLATAGLDEVSIDPVARTARVGAGVRWGAVLEAAQGHGLAPLLGSSPGVGAIGYTLGGGMGWLARPYGLAIDRVRSFDLVTADGSLVTASAREHADLFAALRGGGAGTLGVVVAMVIELVPVTEVYAGNLLYPAEDATAVLERYREWIRTVPDELTSSVCIMNYPPFEAVPEPLRGRSFVMVRGCYTGPVADGADLIDSWRGWRAPAMDLFGSMPFTEVGTISNDPTDPVPGLSTGEWLTELTDDAIAAIVATAVPADGPSALVFAEIRHAGGAIARGDTTAVFGNRDRELLLQMVAMVPTPELRAVAEAEIVRLKAGLGAARSGATYLNFLDGREKRERVADGLSPAGFEHLVRTKQSVDATGLFTHGLAVR